MLGPAMPREVVDDLPQTLPVQERLTLLTEGIAPAATDAAPGATPQFFRNSSVDTNTQVHRLAIQ